MLPVQSLMGVEGNDIGFRAAHALERSLCAAMQFGVGSANSRVLQRDHRGVEPQFF
jgi:hypothetical protein